MKKITFLSLALLIMTGAFAQKKLSLGFKAGINDNSFLLSTDGTGGSDITYHLPGVGFHVGAIADLNLSENISLQPHLLFAKKGGEIEIQSGSTVSKTTFTFYTIDLPINLVYHHQGFFAGAGPNLSYGVSGKGKTATPPTIDLYDKDALGAGTHFTRFEIGANVIMGYTFPSGFLVSANYTPAISDIVKEGPATTGTIKSNNSFIGFSLGYMFGSAKTKK